MGITEGHMKHKREMKRWRKEGKGLVSEREMEEAMLLKDRRGREKRVHMRLIYSEE